MSKLSEHFASGKDTVESFAEKYHIFIKHHPVYTNLVLLKYNQIDSPMDNELVQECRGIILDTDDNFIPVAWPFNKFFNIEDPMSAKIDWSTARVQEKLDGSLIFFYFYDNKWNVASSGTPDAGGQVGSSSLTFRALTFDAWCCMNYSLSDLDKDVTYMFELMTDYNRVVVKHDKTSLILTGARNIITGEEIPVSSFSSRFKIVKEFPLRTINQITESMKHFSGLKQEGYVVVDGYFNRVKIKHPDYVKAHHMLSRVTPKSLLEAARTGEGSEILSYFPELKRELENKLSQFESVAARAQCEYDIISSTVSQKEFALIVNKSQYKSALFSVRSGKSKNCREYYSKCNIEHLFELIGEAE